MSFNIEIFPDAPIMLCTFHHDFDTGKELPALTDECYAVLDAASEPLHFITDSLAYSFSVDDVIDAVGAATYGHKAPFIHENVREVIWVTESKLLELAARGMNTSAFGNIEVKVFSTMEEALAHCHLGS